MSEQKQLFYRLDDYKYIDTPKSRVLSGIRELDYNTKGFEMGCITIWTGFTNAGKTTVMTMIAKNTQKKILKIICIYNHHIKKI